MFECACACESLCVGVNKKRKGQKRQEHSTKGGKEEAKNADCQRCWVCPVGGSVCMAVSQILFGACCCTGLNVYIDQFLFFFFHIALIETHFLNSCNYYLEFNRTGSYGADNQGEQHSINFIERRNSTHIQRKNNNNNKTHLI